MSQIDGGGGLRRASDWPTCVGKCEFVWKGLLLSVGLLTDRRGSGEIFVRILQLGEETSLIKCDIIFSFMPSNIHCCPVKSQRLCWDQEGAVARFQGAAVRGGVAMQLSTSPAQLQAEPERFWLSFLSPSCSSFFIIPLAHSVTSPHL